MKGFSFMQWIVIVILALLTALEPLSIDLYLPGFLQISEFLNTDSASIQISLSTFLAGFAIGQLVWGPLADRFGRKKPILVSLIIFIVSSVGCIYVSSIEQLWVMRFIQAVGGCGGVVISRAVVTDYFDRSNTLKIFALLALIMGIAPILAPTIGNGVLNILGWKGLFGTMMALGVLMFLLTVFLLPETHKTGIVQSHGVLRSYMEVFRVRKFLVYSLVAGIVNGALMIYVANGPFLIMEKGGFSGNTFSLIFAMNASGLMIGSLIATVLQKYMRTSKLVKLTLFSMVVIGLLLLASMYLGMDMWAILAVLFCYMLLLGVLLPATTELAITPFIENSGTASALFGSIQLAIAFVCSIVSSLIHNGEIITVGLSLFLCGVVAFIIVFIPVEVKRSPKESLRPL
ncbi:Bcr/CflA family efflux MFS transporter [Dysgonomonas sp. 216]|uniref:multidrug effflux MFS transporter n=1 Tax=Dysgonomonas sp. 216 TaxID=2302934 RepID=UPI0013D079CE|nr:multidrug effflux MFS transporter [Dysgonomonas sp. 216]NDW17650.1 Bcr/CflA family efflux MFS transporter [Dysgonomonas sp. 216]